jgi:hypothetical protein
MTTLSPNDHPVDAVEIQGGTEIFEKRFDAEETYHRCRAAEMLDAGDAVPFVFDTDSPPNVTSACCVAERRSEEAFETVGSLREDLIGMPGGPEHNPSDIGNVGIRDRLLEEVTHAIYEYHSWFRPPERLKKFGWDQPRIEPIAVRMARYITEPLREGRCVTMLAAGADFHASAYGVPGSIRPFDFGLRAHFICELYNILP